MFALTLSVNVLLLVLVFFIPFCICCMLSSSATRLKKKNRRITVLGNLINSSGFMPKRCLPFHSLALLCVLQMVSERINHKREIFLAYVVTFL